MQIKKYKEKSDAFRMHRQRHKKRFLERGGENLSDLEFLELYLFYAHPRNDVKKLAERLLEVFGSFETIANAPMSKLIEITGVKQHTAILLKLIPELSRRFLAGVPQEILNLYDEETAAKLATSMLMGCKEENVALFCLDSAGNLLEKCIVHRGSAHSVAFSAKIIVDKANENGSSNVILVHNHPNKLALPSQDDFATTEHLSTVLRNIEINLVEHYIVAGMDYYKMIGEN